MKKIAITIGVSILLLGIVLMPCINATTLWEKKLVEPVEIVVVKENNQIGENENHEEPSCLVSIYEKDDSKARAINQDLSCGGTIWGYTGDHFDTWGSSPVPFALVDAGIKKTISAWPMGYYRITGLPLNQEITITASKKGYHSDTLKHTFTELRPTYYYCFDLKEDEDDSINEKNVVETTCLGSIYGSAGTSYGWGFSPVFFAKITAGGRATYSSPIMGSYKISNLPLGTYTITGSKKGYDTFTDTITLTEDRPDKQVFVHLEPNDESVNKATSIMPLFLSLLQQYPLIYQILQRLLQL